MATYQTEVACRMQAQLSAGQWRTLVTMILDEMGFDEDARFEVNWEGEGIPRQTAEVGRSRLLELWQEDDLAKMHQIILSNAWVKGLNFKLHILKRADHATVSFKCEGDFPERRQRLAESLRRRIAEWETESSRGNSMQEQERVFGSLLLDKRVVDSAKGAFLRGDFSSALGGGLSALTRHLAAVLTLPATGLTELGAALCRKPFRLLFPDLSGRALEKELAGLGKMVESLQLLLAEPLNAQKRSIGDPGLVLKYLVLISLLMQRLDAAVQNPSVRKPAAKHKPAAKKAPRPKRPSGAKPRAAGKAKKKAARKK